MTLDQDVEANGGGNWLISSYGESLALGFKGPEDYINRCFNWAHNTGVIGLEARLTWYHGKGAGLAYVCPYSRRHIKRGLTLQFSGEIKIGREVLPKRDWRFDDEWSPELSLLTYDEYQVARLAIKRAKAFMVNRLMRDSFVLDRVISTAPIYSVGRPDRSMHQSDD